jgi:hypothetical protein
MAIQPDDEFEIEVETDETSVSEPRSKPDIEVEDDTPEQDRGREPMPKEIVDELEADELEEYSEKVKLRLKQMKKVWHDERREKERAFREQQETLSAAQRLFEENKRLKSSLSEGENHLLMSFKQQTEYELKEAERAYRDAYEAGDSDRVLEAQKKLTSATVKADNLNNYRPALQAPETEVQIPQQAEKAPEPDRKATEWQENNPWFGQDEEMTATALGLHEKLKRNGVTIGSDEYYKRIDETMRKRFPEQFEEPEVEKPAAEPVRKSSNVVAPATRSTSSKRIKLTNTQVALAKKLGLTPEQYALEIRKLEAQNG